MPYYQLSVPLQPLAAPPADWDRVLAVLTPEEAAATPLPEQLKPPAHLTQPDQLHHCRVDFDAGRILGVLHIPARAKQPARSLSFVWEGSNVLVLASEETGAALLAQVLAMRPHDQGGAGDFLVDLLTALIQDGLPYIQQLEERAAQLEQEILAGRTDRFIHRMSALRKELNRCNRFYAQLNDLADILLENAEDLLGPESAQRMGHFGRRVESLRSESQMLREYASQIASEYQAQIDIGQNRIMKVLTVVTTLCLPLSLIAGWYGMNFAHMPELQWTYGYPAVILVSAGILLGSLWYFRKKNFW